ncbi:ACTIVATING SIGNAL COINTEGRATOR 1 [Salix koriyanagi]|uniref:ACTIVATING SIGNAL COINTEGRATOR 1 n=1 Tax=Salix koriyanagi TaxID=2511006 RepID=A0A9Q0W1L9_9ROSI|nr:ACTIVATING SIGNAL COINTEGRATOR 1 [Salix koriyanagi]
MFVYDTICTHNTWNYQHPHGFDENAPALLVNDQHKQPCTDKIYEAAVRGLVSVEGPMPVKFPFPDPQDPFSLKPGSISEGFSEDKASGVEKSESLSVAIAGARAAATQHGQPDSKSLEEDKMPQSYSCGRSDEESLVPSHIEQHYPIQYQESSSRSQTCEDLIRIPGASTKGFC